LVTRSLHYKLGLATVTGTPVLRAGCCGWCMGRSSYYRAFNAVELQDTFYDRPDPERLSKLPRPLRASPSP